MPTPTSETPTIGSLCRQLDGLLSQPGGVCWSLRGTPSHVSEMYLPPDDTMMTISIVVRATGSVALGPKTRLVTTHLVRQDGQRYRAGGDSLSRPYEVLTMLH